MVGELDPELYNEDLDWYFGCFESECGIRSVQQAAEEMIRSGSMHTSVEHDERDWEGNWDVKVSKTSVSRNHEFPYTDRHVRFSRGEGSFTRGRRIWNRFVRLPFATQAILTAYYTPKRDKPEVAAEIIRAAHRAFLS